MSTNALNFIRSYNILTPANSLENSKAFRKLNSNQAPQNLESIQSRPTPPTSFPKQRKTEVNIERIQKAGGAGVIKSSNFFARLYQG
jgi:hypothetical protein